MLAQAAMPVVIVIEETITLCTLRRDGREATCQMVVVPVKVPQRRAGWETIQVERVNPSS